MDLPEQRLIIRNKIYDICENVDVWRCLSLDDKQKIARRLERGCFEVVIADSKRDSINRSFDNKEFVDRYSTVCYKVMSNVDKFLHRIIKKEVDPHDIAWMTSYELDPSASYKERQEIEIRQKQKMIYKVSNMFVCRKCGKNETIPLEYQGRAGDEASSFSIKCVNCEYVWRK